MQTIPAYFWLKRTTQCVKATGRKKIGVNALAVYSECFIFSLTLTHVMIKSSPGALRPRHSPEETISTDPTLSKLICSSIVRN